MLVFAKEVVGPDVRCEVHKMRAQALSWEFTIKNDDDFELFIKRVAEAWSDCLSDKQELVFTVHQVNPSDVGDWKCRWFISAKSIASLFLIKNNWNIARHKIAILVADNWFCYQQNTLRKEAQMDKEKKTEEKRDDGYVLCSTWADNDEEVKQFVGHLEWWKQLAKANGKTLVLEAKLI